MLSRLAAPGRPGTTLAARMVLMAFLAASALLAGSIATGCKGRDGGTSGDHPPGKADAGKDAASADAGTPAGSWSAAASSTARAATPSPDLGPADSTFPIGFEHLSFGLDEDGVRTVRPRASRSLVSPSILSEPIPSGDPFLSAIYVLTPGAGLTEVRFTFGDVLRGEPGFKEAVQAGISKWGATTELSEKPGAERAVWDTPSARLEVRLGDDGYLLLVVSKPSGKAGPETSGSPGEGAEGTPDGGPGRR